VQKIASAGRARAIMQAGKVRVIRDDEQTVPVAVFSQRNMKAGSFSIDLATPTDDTADQVETSYFDATVWQQRKVTTKLPDSTSARPAKIESFGVTSREQITRDGMYLAAANRYRRKFPRFSAEMDGFIPIFGDLIAIQHDMMGWGEVADSVAWYPATNRITLDQAPQGTPTVAAFRTDTGGMDGPHTITAIDGATLTLATVPGFNIERAGQDRERTHVLLGTSTTYSTKAKVTDVRPVSLYEVQITAVVDDPSVYTAEDGVVADPLVTSGLPRAPAAPILTGLFARFAPDDTTRIILGWNPAPGANVYDVEIAEGIDADDPDLIWTRLIEVVATQTIVMSIYEKRTLVRVRGVGILAGPWVSAVLGELTPPIWTADSAAKWTSDPNLIWSS
jgi:hypothetical protein